MPVDRRPHLSVYRQLSVSGNIRSSGSPWLLSNANRLFRSKKLVFNGQEPVRRRGKATGRGAFEVQSAQAICAAYYFDLMPRDYSLADAAIELVVKRLP